MNKGKIIDFSKLPYDKQYLVKMPNIAPFWFFDSGNKDAEQKQEIIFILENFSIAKIAKNKKEQVTIKKGIIERFVGKIISSEYKPEQNVSWVTTKAKGLEIQAVCLGEIKEGEYLELKKIDFGKILKVL